MKSLICTIVLAICIPLFSQAQKAKIYICQNGTASLYSETPIENITANSNLLNVILNTNTNEINYLVAMKSFKFTKSLMQEHFNEKYVESDKFPNAIFKGKINENINWNKNGVFNITSTGLLTIHGVDKMHTEKGTLTIKDGKYTIEGNFVVKLVEHNIEIPKIVITQIAESINVKHRCILIPYIPKAK